MRDKTHKEQIEKWANYVKSNPKSKWKPQLDNLINSQILIAKKFYKKLEQTPEGKQKIAELKKLKT